MRHGSLQRRIPWMTVLCVVYGLMTIPVRAQAQPAAGEESASVLVNVTAVVQNASVQMEMLTGLDIGEVQPSQKVIFVDPAMDPGAALIRLLGRPHAIVQVTYSESMEMTNAINQVMEVHYLVNGEEENEQFASTRFDQNPVVIRLNDQGEYYLWIGCRFIVENAVRGQYDGEFLLEVEYH